MTRLISTSDVIRLALPLTLLTVIAVAYQLQPWAALQQRATAAHSESDHRQAAESLRSAEAALLAADHAAAATAARATITALADAGDGRRTALTRGRAHEILAEVHLARDAHADAQRALTAALADYRRADLRTAVARIEARLPRPAQASISPSR